MTDVDRTRLAWAFIGGLSLILAGLLWGLNRTPTYDPAWDDLPDGGVLLGEDLCDVLPDGCTEWRDGGEP